MATTRRRTRPTERSSAVSHAADSHRPVGPQAITPDALARLHQAIGNQAVARLHGARRPVVAPAVQRAIVWNDGPRAKVLNQVGPLWFRDHGTTPATINASEFPGGDPATVLVGPQLAIAPGGAGTARVTVTAEPTNTVGYRMELPTTPPWWVKKSKAEAASALGMVGGDEISAGLTEFSNKPGDVVVEAKGLPDDAGFATKVETHENHHVEEIRTTVNDILRPWDSQITAFRVGGQAVEARAGQNPAAEFYRAVGGTPAEIGSRMVADFELRGKAFHATKEGGPATIERYDLPGIWHKSLRFWWRHPTG